MLVEKEVIPSKDFLWAVFVSFWFLLFHYEEEEVVVERCFSWIHSVPKPPNNETCDEPPLDAISFLLSFKWDKMKFLHCNQVLA